MKAVDIIVLTVVLFALFFAYCLGKRLSENGTTYEIGNEEDEKARKKLIEREDKDIELNQE